MMMPLTHTSPTLIDEIILIDFVALFLAIVTVSILWYLVKKLFPNEDRDVRFLLTFIGVVVPFVMLIYFGLAVINYEAIAVWSGWPQVLPVKNSLSPLILGTVVFYVGQTVWRWLDWRCRYQARRQAAVTSQPTNQPSKAQR